MSILGEIFNGFNQKGLDEVIEKLGQFNEIYLVTELLKKKDEFDPETQKAIFKLAEKTMEKYK